MTWEKSHWRTAEMQVRNWDNLRFLLAVARAGGNAEAARRLAVDETTVGRRIAALERTIGAPLLEGPMGARRPTEAGPELVAIAEETERRLGLATETVSATRDAHVGPVRVTAVPMLANRVIIPALPTLRDKHPRIVVELIATPEDLSILGRQADIALRFGAPGEEKDAVARRVATLRYGVYGRRGAEGWIVHGGRLAGLPHSKAIDAMVGSDQRAVMVDDGDTMAWSIDHGLGKGLLPEIVGDDLARASRLPMEVPKVERPLWMILHPDGRHLARVRAVAAWIADLFGEKKS
jgi:DNA-binding transcriptional LysR family regulator